MFAPALPELNTPVPLQEVTDSALSRLTAEVREMTGRLEGGIVKIDTAAASADSRVAGMESVVETLRDQLWELDTANRNNLVFYGVSFYNI